MSPGLRIIIDAAIILVMSGFCWLIIAWLRRTGGKLERTGYRTFFAFGIIWVPIGIIGLMISLLTRFKMFIAEPFLMMGIVFLIFGLVYRSRWHKIKGKQGEN